MYPVHADHKQACDEGAEDLGEDVVRHFPPGEALPDGEADGHGWVEVSAGRGCAGDDGKGDTDAECPSDLKEGTKRRDTKFLCAIEEEGGGRCYAGEAVIDKVRIMLLLVGNKNGLSDEKPLLHLSEMRRKNVVQNSKGA